MQRDEVGAYRWVAFGLAFFVVTHVLGMLTMATLLRPGMDAFVFEAGERMRYVAEHPWAWRLGWMPWQASALSDLVLGVALARWLAGRPGRAGFGWALFGLAMWVASAMPEQWAEAMLVSAFVDRAQAGEAVAWDRDWTLYVRVTGVWAASGYVLMTAAWMMAIRRASGRGAWPLGAELGLLATFALAAALTWRATLDGGDAWFGAASAVSALAFPMVTLWTLGVAVRAGELARRDRPDASDAALALRWPAGRALGWLAPLASDGVRDVLRVFSRFLPYPTLRSDIRDVVYLTWLVPVVRVAHLVPEGVALDAFDGHTPLSILTYRHGGFGPALLGPLRRLMPSPAQSNWRLYVEGRSGDGEGAVFFLKNVIDHPAYVVGSRMLSDGLPAHLPAQMVHARCRDTIETRISPGDGSAPDLVATVRETENRRVPAELRSLGETFEDVLAYLVPRGAAVRTHPAVGLRSASLIVVDPGEVRPLELTAPVESAWLAPIVEGAEPFAFVIREVRFAATGERWTALGR